MVEFSNTLIDWYSKYKRDLPWRNISDPYFIWVSEIILQQTRVIQGINYYLRFVDRFPSVAILANASENEVLNYWQGLGYYSRARNLHKGAKFVVSEFGGEFPSNYSDVLKIPGVGVYTAAAICSFAYNLPYAVVDGNVYRVISRIYGISEPIDTSIGKNEFARIAQKLLSLSSPGIHNQAIMEFGALQCVPSSPKCVICPFNNICKAYESNLVSELPVKSKKIKVKSRYFNYLFIEFEGNTFLQKRTEKDIWQNLYELPLIETPNLLTVEELLANANFKDMFKDVESLNLSQISEPIKHVLTHRIIMAQFFTITISNVSDVLREKDVLPMSEIGRFPVSRLTEIFLERNRAI